MAYTSQTQIERAITAALVIQLTDDSGVGTADTAVLDEAIADAGREVDGYVRAHYSVPVSPTPAMLQTIAIDLTIWRLFRRRHGVFGMPEQVQDTYAARIKQLEKINEGKLDLGVDALPTVSAKVVAQTAGPDQMFTGGSSGTLRDF